MDTSGLARRAASFAIAAVAAASLAGCAGGGGWSGFGGFGPSQPPAPEAPPPEPEIPSSIRPDELVGRWGLASFHKPDDRMRTENAAKGQCKQPYLSLIHI